MRGLIWRKAFYCESSARVELLSRDISGRKEALCLRVLVPLRKASRRLSREVTSMLWWSCLNLWTELAVSISIRMRL